MQVAGWEGGPPSFFLHKAQGGLIIRPRAKGLSMVRVYEPNKTEKDIDEILTQLYLLKNALSTEKKAKLEERVNKIRGLLLDAKESLSS